MSDVDRKARARARREVAVLRKARLQAQEQELSPIRGAAALSLVTRLTAESWSLGRLDVPAYERNETPCRFVPSRIT